MKKIKDAISSILLVVVIFYVIFPAALPLFGFSFIFTSGILGLALYAYNRFPFPEIISLVLLFVLLIGWTLLCQFVNTSNDTFIFEYAQSQIAWIFSSYLVVYLFFKRHPDKGIHVLVYYIIAAITIQGIISVWMYFDPVVSDFFEKIQMSTGLAADKRMETEGKRLLGYGIAFFGAGIVFGLSLILIVYIFMTHKLNFIQKLLIALLYVATFLVGMMSARTAVVGLIASLCLMVLLYFKGDNKYRSQGITIMFYAAILTSIGVTVVFTFFSEFAEWTFEPFLVYRDTGEIRTNSSDGLYVMFTYPTNFYEWMFGWGKGAFWGSDVGYTRLFFWFGLPGTLLFFGYQYTIMKRSFSADKYFNITLLIIFAFNLALNIKGLSDLNHFNYIFMMYFLYYRYFIYTPYLYRLGKVKETTLRYAIQGSPTGRRI